MKAAIFFVLIAKMAAADECQVVPITQWAEEASSRSENLTLPVNLVVIQHTATNECLTDAQCENTLNIIRNYHRENLGYDDIAQSFLIGGDGKVYEGAGWTHIGAHTRNHNNRSIGISFVGTFTKKVPTSQALQAVLDLVSCGVKNQYLSSEYQVVGHRQVSRTLSPGDALQREIEIWPHWVRNVH